MCLLVPCPSCAHSIHFAQWRSHVHFSDFIRSCQRHCMFGAERSHGLKCSFVMKMADCVTVNKWFYFSDFISSQRHCMSGAEHSCWLKCSFVMKMAKCVTVNQWLIPPPPPTPDILTYLVLLCGSLSCCLLACQVWCHVCSSFTCSGAVFLHQQFAFLLTSMYTQHHGCILCQ